MITLNATITTDIIPSTLHFNSPENLTIDSDCNVIIKKCKQVILSAPPPSTPPSSPIQVFALSGFGTTTSLSGEMTYHGEDDVVIDHEDCTVTVKRGNIVYEDRK